MLGHSEKTREEILAERQEKKKKKAALKNQPKGKVTNSEREIGDFSKSQPAANKNFSPSGLEKKKSAVEKDTDVSSKCSSFHGKEVVVSEKKDGDAFHSVSKITDKGISNILVHCHVDGSESNQKEDQLTANKKVAKECFNQTDQVKNKEIANEVGTKTKAQLRAERRAKQEAERAKKLEKTSGSAPEKKKKTILKMVDETPAKIPNNTNTSVQPLISHKVKLFAHLYNISKDTDAVDSPVKVHPSVIQLGAKYTSRVVTGANACCLALLNALKKVVMDFETPPNQEFSRGLEAEITKSMNYLNKCRPAAVSMVNAVKHLKFQVNQSKGSDLECKNNINEWIETYIKEELEMAAKAICLFVREKIAPGDVILTYGCSSLIQQILLSVHNEGINFQVIVADGRPWLEGREMLKKLVSVGIRCTYVFVTGLSFVMPEVTKILLGAHALLANGYVMSRAGSSQIALLAKTYNVPVLVCCETHKFSEKVQTDSFVYNELGDPDDLTSSKGCLSKELTKWKSIPYLTPLNLTYDVTPPDLVSAVVTEIAVLPCTSVPVILRIKPPDVSC